MAYAYAAPLYRDAGWTDVLPIVMPGAAKNPPPNGYTGRHAVTPSDDAYARWSDPIRRSQCLSSHAAWDLRRRC